MSEEHEVQAQAKKHLRDSMTSDNFLMEVVMFLTEQLGGEVVMTEADRDRVVGGNELSMRLTGKGELRLAVVPESDES